MKSSISVLLVEPENPDNIGAVARAMKNMALEDLRLVCPPDRWKTLGKKLAMSGREVLQKAAVFSSVEDAVQDAFLVIGTSRRKRRFAANVISFEEGICKISKEASKDRRVIVMFGKESKGLSNEALDHCDWVMKIPANPAYPSMNLAQAVMIVTFAVFRKRNPREEVLQDLGAGGEFASKEKIYDVLESLGSALRVLNYAREGVNVPERILGTFHGLIKRNGLLQREAQMLKGLCRRIVSNQHIRTPEYQEGGDPVIRHLIHKT